MKVPSLSRLGRISRIYYHYRRRTTCVPYSPIFAGIETSGLCNLRCVMCPHGQEQYPARKRGHMTFEVFQRVVDEAKAFIYDADLFGGGEPLLNPRIFDMIAYAKTAGIHTRLHTNATLLGDEESRALIASGLDFLSISFEGYSKEIYERTRVNAVYERTLDSIHGFLSAKATAGQRKPYTVLQVIQPEPGKLAETLRAGLDSLHKAVSSHTSLDEFRVIGLHNYGGKVAAPNRTRQTQYTPCTFLWYAVYVLWDGTIVPCCVDWWGEYSLGNITEVTLLDAWHGKKAQRLRALIGTRQYRDVPLCRGCDRLWRSQRLGVPLSSAGVARQWVSHHLFGY